MNVQQKTETAEDRFGRAPSVLESYAIICGETHMSVIEAMARAYLDALAPGGFRDPEEREAAALQRIGPMRAALAEARKHGWQLVPVEPTQYMKDRSGNTRAADVWRAMLTAAPSVKDNT